MSCADTDFMNLGCNNNAWNVVSNCLRVKISCDLMSICRPELSLIIC